MNSYYTPTGSPAAGSKADSRPLRTEFSRVAAGFDKLPVLIGGNNKPVVVNDSASGFTTTAGTLTLSGAFATTGAFSTTFVGQAAISITLPSTAQTLATLAGAETLSSKSITSPVFSGTITGTYTFGATTVFSGAIMPSPVLSGTTTGTVTFGGTPTINATTFAGSTLLRVVNATVTNPTVSTGALTMNSGYGGAIRFPSTQNPSANANTLDDYEYGNYSPTLTAETPGDMSLSGSAVYGGYIKIGRCVYYNFFIVGTLNYTTASGALLIPLPFTASSSGMKLSGPFSTAYGCNITATNVRAMSTTIGYKSLNYATLHYSHVTGGTSTIINVTDWSTAANLALYGAIIYWTD